MAENSRPFPERIKDVRGGRMFWETSDERIIGGLTCQSASDFASSGVQFVVYEVQHHVGDGTHPH